MRIFEVNLEDTFARCEKYSSKLDISRSLIRIFAFITKDIGKIMTDNNKRSTMESAMRDGTILGMLWIVTFSVSIVMLKTMFNNGGLLVSLAVVVLSASSPFLAYKLAVKHRNNERGGTISYGEAWMHIATMYVCAILLSSLAQFVFYAYIDPHIFGNMIPLFEKFAIENNIDASSINLFTELFANMEKMSAGNIVLSQASGHITRDILLTSLLAIAVKNNS